MNLNDRETQNKVYKISYNFLTLLLFFGLFAFIFSHNWISSLETISVEELPVIYHGDLESDIILMENVRVISGLVTSLLFLFYIFIDHVYRKNIKNSAWYSFKQIIGCTLLIIGGFVVYFFIELAMMQEAIVTSVLILSLLGLIINTLYLLS